MVNSLFAVVGDAPASRGWIPVESDIERNAAHESGHAVIGLALGTKIDYIGRLEEVDLPLSLRSRDFHGGCAVNFTSTCRKLEPRLQFLIAMGGIAAETFLYNKYNEAAAASDFESLKPNVLSQAEIEGLIAIGGKVINQNLQFFHHLRQSLAKRIKSSEVILATGASVNVRFKRSGRNLDVTSDLDSLLPL